MDVLAEGGRSTSGMGHYWKDSTRFPKRKKKETKDTEQAEADEKGAFRFDFRFVSYGSSPRVSTM